MSELFDFSEINRIQAEITRDLEQAKSLPVQHPQEITVAQIKANDENATRLIWDFDLTDEETCSFYRETVKTYPVITEDALRNELKPIKKVLSAHESLNDFCIEGDDFDY